MIISILDKVRGTFNKFPVFFVQAFKIVVDLKIQYIITDQFFFLFQVQMNIYSGNWNTPY